MVASPRHILIAVLMLLQIALPLVHAHVGGNSEAAGLHLHELENLRPRIDQPDIRSADHQLTPAFAVAVGQAIKCHTADIDAVVDVFPTMGDTLSLIRPLVGRIVFDRRTPPVRPNPVYNQNLTRAPPG